MSRVGAGDIYQVKPSSNVYTVLLVVATLASIAALVMLYVQANALFGQGGLLG